MGIVFKDENSKNEIDNISEELLQKSYCEYIRKVINTSYGETSILVTPDDKDKPYLFILHGGSGNAAITGWLFDSLSKKYNLIIPDIIGGTGNSVEKFLDPNSDEYGLWLNEVVASFEIDEVNIFAISQGAYAALRYIELKNAKLNKIILYVPAGFINPRIFSSTFKFFIPLVKFRIFKCNFLYRFIEKNIFSDKPSELISSFFRKVFCYTRFDMRQPKMIMDQCPLKDYKAFVISAENDLFFSGTMLKNRAAEYFKSDVKTTLLKKSNHSLTKNDIRFDKLLIEIEDFIDED